MVAFFIYLQPIIATALSLVLLGERLTLQTVLGAALIFVAVYFTLGPRRGRRRDGTKG